MQGGNLPSSRWDNIPDIITVLRTVKPKSVLDVGCGFGKWGFLTREFCDVWGGNYYKKDWQTKIDAVEIFPQYIQSWHREIYNNILIGNVTELPLVEYDLILACDVLEHIPEDKIASTIEALKARTKNLIISVPLGVRPQGKLYNNEFETHRSTWDIEKIKAYKPDYLKTHGQQALAVWTGYRLSHLGVRKPICLFVARDDYSNLGYLLSKSLNSVGVEAKAISFNPNDFNYPETAEICNMESYSRYAASAEVIVAMQSQYFQCNLTGKKLFIFHGGSIYRHNSSRLNNAFNQIVTGTILQHWDFLDKGAKNQHWLLPPVDTELIQPDYTYHDKLFAHYPHKADMKGSNKIVKILKEAKTHYLYDDTTIDWSDNLKRISECDIYIEQLCPHEWGLSALEAAALGKIVITTFRGLEDYRKQYGECELVIANTEDELEQQVKEIMTWSKEQILEKKMATREWAEKYHSFEAVGQRLKEILNE